MPDENEKPTDSTLLDIINDPFSRPLDTDLPSDENEKSIYSISLNITNDAFSYPLDTHLLKNTNYGYIYQDGSFSQNAAVGLSYSPSGKIELPFVGTFIGSSININHGMFTQHRRSETRDDGTLSGKTMKTERPNVGELSIDKQYSFEKTLGKGDGLRISHQSTIKSDITLLDTDYTQDLQNWWHNKTIGREVTYEHDLVNTGWEGSLAIGQGLLIRRRDPEEKDFDIAVNAGRIIGTNSDAKQLGASARIGSGIDGIPSRSQTFLPEQTPAMQVYDRPNGVSWAIGASYNYYYIYKNPVIDGPEHKSAESVHELNINADIAAAGRAMLSVGVTFATNPAQKNLDNPDISGPKIDTRANVGVTVFMGGRK